MPDMNSPGEEQPTERKSRLLGVWIKREVDILALLAFLMSLSALGWQGWNALRGPEVLIAPVRQSVIYLKEVVASTGDTAEAIYIAAVITIYNLGAPGYGDFVLGQTAELSVGACNLTFDAQNLVKLGKSGGTLSLPKYVDDWGGVALEHGKAVTRSVEFSALFVESNLDVSCARPERFLEAVADGGDLTITFTATTVSGVVEPFLCSISNLDQFVSTFRHRRIAALACG